jgi:hypothetical protein
MLRVATPVIGAFMKDIIAKIPEDHTRLNGA